MVVSFLSGSATQPRSNAVGSTAAQKLRSTDWVGPTTYTVPHRQKHRGLNRSAGLPTPGGYEANSENDHKEELLMFTSGRSSDGNGVIASEGQDEGRRLMHGGS